LKTEQDGSVTGQTFGTWEKFWMVGKQEVGHSLRLAGPDWDHTVLATNPSHDMHRPTMQPAFTRGACPVAWARAEPRLKLGSLDVKAL
jgi:hypothetical protein